ncbi:MAG: phage terminase large subunit [Vicinamibacterales bacterium]
MTKPDARRLAALVDEIQLRRARVSLRAFVELMWPVLEPATPFVPGPHIDLVCAYLEAVTAGETRRLVINLPPRHMKSLLVSVLWPCWEWYQRPAERYVFASYAEGLALHHSVLRRRLIRSRVYQRFAPGVQLTRDQDQKGEFHNTRGGAMVATSTGGSITGKGGGRIIIDDPHNPTQAESDTQREQAIDFFRHTLSTRLDDPAHGAIVLVMQRLHMRDLTAVCVELGFEHVVLPAMAPARTTITFPRSARVLERAPDEPLWPARQSADELSRQRALMGSYAFSGQYQQQPVPREGAFFHPEWWRFYDEVPRRFDEVIQSWDTAFKGGDTSDYVVGLVAGRLGAQTYLLDRFKAKASFSETQAAIRLMRDRYPDTRRVLIEDTANGPAIINSLKGEVRGLIAVKPEGGKRSRAAAAQPIVEAGQVLLPQTRWPDGQRRLDRTWVEDFLDAVNAFPAGAHDDDTDALTQLLVYGVTHPANNLTGEILRMQAEEGDEREGVGIRERWIHTQFGGWAGKIPNF